MWHNQRVNWVGCWRQESNLVVAMSSLLIQIAHSSSFFFPIFRKIYCLASSPNTWLVKWEIAYGVTWKRRKTEISEGRLSSNVYLYSAVFYYGRDWIEVCVRVEEHTKVDFMSLFIAVHLIKLLKARQTWNTQSRELRQFTIVCCTPVLGWVNSDRFSIFLKYLKNFEKRSKLTRNSDFFARGEHATLSHHFEPT